MPTVIKVENLSKYYRLGLIGGKTLHDDLNRWWARVRKQPDPLLKIGQEDRRNGNDESIWALRDVSFEVQQGEIVGIIGRNGAGKSTLLKILSRITAPTSGQVKVKGRIASLLEVGTGFHPELTGRENIYLNGAILGMKKAEIDRKFDEIVAFAEVEKFIDTPVKRYSSGMYVRLAFAVAAHLEPEILVVDEVLAVGDAAFQKKCLGKMGEVAKQGRTVLFVSHSMPSIIRLCYQAIWVDAGHIKFEGPTNGVVAAYLSDGTSATGERTWSDIAKSPGDNRIRLLAVRVNDDEGNTKSTLDNQHPFYIEIEYQILKRLPPMRIVFTLSTNDGLDIFTSTDMADPAWAERFRLPGRYVSRCRIPDNFLIAGNYILRVGADIPFIEILFTCNNALSFELMKTGGISGRFPEKWAGIICPRLSWSVFELDSPDVKNG
ncbi:ABC transporter ATP-binding protein [candidate division KSB1 bacterium]|nr:MAG: ABC transporter ATP-binding protein [candidate division KSB1 bacterium]